MMSTPVLRPDLLEHLRADRPPVHLEEVVGVAEQERVHVQAGQGVVAVQGVRIHELDVLGARPQRLRLLVVLAELVVGVDLDHVLAVGALLELLGEDERALVTRVGDGRAVPERQLRLRFGDGGGDQQAGEGDQGHEVTHESLLARWAGR